MLLISVSKMTSKSRFYGYKHLRTNKKFHEIVNVAINFLSAKFSTFKVCFCVSYAYVFWKLSKIFWECEIYILEESESSWTSVPEWQRRTTFYHHRVNSWWNHQKQAKQLAVASYSVIRKTDIFAPDQWNLVPDQELETPDHFLLWFLIP